MSIKVERAEPVVQWAAKIYSFRIWFYFHSLLISLGFCCIMTEFRRRRLPVGPPHPGAPCWRWSCCPPRLNCGSPPPLQSERPASASRCSVWHGRKQPTFSNCYCLFIATVLFKQTNSDGGGGFWATTPTVYNKNTQPLKMFKFTNMMLV